MMDGTASTPSTKAPRKIDPSRRMGTRMKPDNTPDDNDRIETGPTALAFEEWERFGVTPPDMPALREYRLERVVKEIQERDLGGVLLFDPLNIRYATDSTNMQLWVTHNRCRAAYVGPDGHICLWDFHNGEHLSSYLPLVKEVRTGASFFYFINGDRVPEAARKFADDFDSVLRAHGGSNRRVAVDIIETDGVRAFDALGIEILDGGEVMAFARAIKNENEINALRCATITCEQAMHEMRKVAVPGATEVDIWAELQKGNHIRGGEWSETRILSSGPRTNPWFQECGPRVLQNGDILAFDTDLVATYGYCCDISRTWKIGDQKPTEYEKDIYKAALDHIEYNRSILKPGMGFRELVEKAQPLPEKYVDQRYGVAYHGIGLCDEYPAIPYPQDWDSIGYDGVIVPGMALTVEVYFGEVGGPCGIKLEDMLVMTETGYENISSFPFEEDFLS